MVNLGSKNVKGAFGQTYGTTPGRFVNGQETFEPSDIEILVPGGMFFTCIEMYREIIEKQEGGGDGGCLSPILRLCIIM